MCGILLWLSMNFNIFIVTDCKYETSFAGWNTMHVVLYISEKGKKKNFKDVLIVHGGKLTITLHWLKWEISSDFVYLNQTNILYVSIDYLSDSVVQFYTSRWQTMINKF